MPKLKPTAFKKIQVLNKNRYKNVPCSFFITILETDFKFDTIIHYNRHLTNFLALIKTGITIYAAPIRNTVCL